MNICDWGSGVSGGLPPCLFMWSSNFCAREWCWIIKRTAIHHRRMWKAFMFILGQYVGVCQKVCVNKWLAQQCQCDTMKICLGLPAMSCCTPLCKFDLENIILGLCGFTFGIFVGRVLQRYLTYARRACNAKGERRAKCYKHLWNQKKVCLFVAENRKTCPTLQAVEWHPLAHHNMDVQNQILYYPLHQFLYAMLLMILYTYIYV